MCAEFQIKNNRIIDLPLLLDKLASLHISPLHIFLTVFSPKSNQKLSISIVFLSSLHTFSISLQTSLCLCFYREFHILLIRRTSDRTPKINFTLRYQLSFQTSNQSQKLVFNLQIFPFSPLYTVKRFSLFKFFSS